VFSFCSTLFLGKDQAASSTDEQWTPRILQSRSLRRRSRRRGDRLHDREVELAGGMVDVEAADVAGRVKVDEEAVRDLARLGARVRF
jgi:hypothetical protein